MTALYKWLARIHIGRWSDRIEWQRALERCSRRWFVYPPVVPVSDGKGRILLDTLRGRRRSPVVQSWQDAGLLMGLDEKDSIEYAARVIDPMSGDWKRSPRHPDEALLAHVLKKRDALPLPAQKTTLGMVSALKKERATIPYRAELPHLRYVDTIGMVTGFLTSCGREDVALAQIEEYDRALLPGTSIPAHAWDLEREVPMGIYDWCRGAGWYALGLVEGNTRGRFNKRIVTLARDMLRFRRADGGWSAMFFNPRSPFESSGSALIGLLMLEAYRIEGDGAFLEAARAVERRLMQATRRSGALDWCQGDTLGTGIYSRAFSVMPFAQGVVLRLSKELNMYANR